MRFQSKVAVVTGAASGFGAAIARRFATEGAAVVVADIDEAGGKEVVAAIESDGGRALFVRTDVSRSEDVAAMVDVSVRRFDGLDVLVNNAGFSHLGMPLEELPEQEFDRVFAVNVKGVYLGAKYAIPVMKARGAGVIVNTASIGAVAPRPNVTAYNATKAAVVTLTRGLAVELAPAIRVNAVNPVAAETNFMKGVTGAALTERARAALIRGIPMDAWRSLATSPRRSHSSPRTTPSS